jgi:hypothetical protein
MAPLIHIRIKNDNVYDKNVIVLIANFLVQIFIVMVITDFLFKIYMVMVIADHQTTWIFCVVIGLIGKIDFIIGYTHL